jgi:hypothetical protein
VNKRIPRDQISYAGSASYKSSCSREAYKADIASFTVVTDPLFGLKDVPKSVIMKISKSPINFYRILSGLRSRWTMFRA